MKADTQNKIEKYTNDLLIHERRQGEYCKNNIYEQKKNTHILNIFKNFRTKLCC